MPRYHGETDYGHPSYDTREDYLRGYGGSYRVARNNYWSRGREMSLAAYNGLIGLVLLYGFGLNVILVTCCAQYFANINHIALIIGYLVLCITGIVISRKSENPWVSFFGYNLVVVPVGIVLSVCLQGVSAVSVTHALATTAGVVTIMLIASTMAPQVFLSLGRILGLALLAVIIVEVLLAIFGVLTPTFLDVIVVIIFCGYIGYDWAKAQGDDHTPDAAVDACVRLYLDIVNLFTRILSLYSRRRD